MDQIREKGISKKVYIGNIPYTANKEEVESLLRIVGPVINFELNYDKDPGKEKKHKGFGFCEYPDYETALSAIRNLNELEFQSRCLKVGFEAKAEQTMASKGLKNDSNDFDQAAFEAKNEKKEINEVLACLDISQKYFIMRELKNIKELAEPEVKNMLMNNPKLSRDLLKIQKELGMDNKKKIKLKKKSPKKTISKTIVTPSQALFQEKNQRDFQKNKLKPKENDRQIESVSDPYHAISDGSTKNSNTILNHQDVQRYENPHYPNQNANRMYYNMNQTLMMDIHNGQLPNFQNDNMINRGFAPKNVNNNNIPPQGFMRGNQHPISQQYHPNQGSFMGNFSHDNEKKWSVRDHNNFDSNDHFFNNMLNNNKYLMENEKIKKKETGYFQNNFPINQNDHFRAHQPSQDGFDLKGEMDLGNDAEFSPENFEVNDDLKNILFQDDEK